MIVDKAARAASLAFPIWEDLEIPLTVIFSFRSRLAAANADTKNAGNFFVSLRFV